MKKVLGIAAAVIVLAGVSAAVVVTTSAASPASQALPVTYGFDGHQGWAHGAVRPHALYLGAGGSLFVRRVRWIGWSQAGARGSGTRWADNCVPSCAAGSFARSAATITLSRVRTHHGQRYFSRMRIAWRAGGKPHQQTFRWSAGTGASAAPFWH